MDNQKFTENRKFHDIWAFFFYFICLVTCIWYCNSSLGSMNIQNHATPDIFNVAIYNVLIMIVLNFIALLLIMTIPKALIFFSLLFIPVLNLALFFMTAQIGFLFSSAVSFLISFLVFMFVLTDLEFSCLVIKKASRIVAEYFGLILFTYVFLCAISGLLLIPIFRLSNSSNEKEIAFSIGCFMFFWTTLVSSYLYDVMVAGIVYGEITKPPHKKDQNVARNAFKATFYAIGTVCYAAMILAFIKALRSSYNNQANSIINNNNNNNTAVFNQILAAIVLIFIGCLISILETFVSTINRFLMPYVAVKGKNLKNSMIESFDLIYQKRVYALSTFCGAAYVTYFVKLIGIFIIIALNGAFIFYFDKSSNKSFLFSNIVIGIIASIMHIQFITCVSSASLAMIYSFAFAKESFNNYDPALFKEFESKEYLIKPSLPPQIIKKTES
ncbi:hypothetical protein NUSPORA_00771 [Nucleospora cyclopteri]